MTDATALIGHAQALDHVIDRVVDAHSRRVHVHAGLTTLMARERNLHLVATALESAGVPWFLVPAARDQGSAVGVREEHRAAAATALRRTLKREIGYVSVVEPQPRQLTQPLLGDRPTTWERHVTDSVVRLTWFRTEPTSTIVCGGETGVDVEFWSEQDGRLLAPRRNQVASSVRADAPLTRVPTGAFSKMYARPVSGEELYPTFAEFVWERPDDITFPVDVVYTWVDASDPSWASRRAAVTGTSYHSESASAARFLNRDELRYSLRSIHAYAPWVRNVFVVTDAQRPSWLVEDSGVQVVDHREIFASDAALPTYNSHAIESRLHHVPGLSEHFLYLNDDMFFGRPVVPQTFFTGSGLTKAFLSSSRVPMDPVGEDDTPVDAALKNNRQLLGRRFGRTMSQTFLHAPYVLRRDVLADIERTFPEEHARTAGSRFRSTQDLSITSSLHHYWAMFSGLGLASSLRSSYTQLAVPDLGERLVRLLHRRDNDAFCLNDAFSDESEIAGQLALLRPFLESYFPVPSPHERG